MKKTISLLLLLFLSSVNLAQTQQGIVKTNGRPSRPGVPLENVAVKASGRNTSLSATDGSFSIPMNGMKAGEAFFLTSVTKLGYELADRNAIGRRYGFSASVPVILTMVSKTEVEEEKQRIRNNAIMATQKKYEQRVEELEKKFEEKAITADAFGEQLQELQSKMDKYNDLVENLADKYARTDYDQIDSLDQEINQAIEEGLFDKADSLIHTKGDMGLRHQKALEWNQSSKKQKKAIDEQMSQWQSSEALRMRELENLAEDYYHSFTIEVSRMHPEKAIEWLKKRSELDPDRFEWLIEVGKYYNTYLAKYDIAMEYFERAQKIAKRTNQDLQNMLVLNVMGGIYIAQHKLDRAEKCYKESLSLAKKDSTSYYDVIAITYNNLGKVEGERDHFDKALNYYEKSLAVCHDTLLSTAVYSYINIASIYYRKNQFDHAFIFTDKAIDIASHENDKLLLSTCIQNKGAIFHGIGKHKEALSCYERALALQKEIFPLTHPSIANTILNISTTYYSMSRIKESLDYTIQALSIFQEIYGEKHPNIASCYKSIATIMSGAGQYSKALSYEDKSWEIYKMFYSDETIQYAQHCNNLGIIYDGLKQDSLATDCYKKAINIYESMDMKKTISYADVCNNITVLLSTQKKYDEAMKYSDTYLEIIASLKGKESLSYINGMNNKAYIYSNCGHSDKALAIYKEAEELIMKTSGKWHKDLAMNYNNAGCIYLNRKEYDEARNLFLKGLEICDSIYKQPSENTMFTLGNIAMTYYRDEKWREAIPWIERASAIRLQIVDDEHRRYSYHSYIYDCYYQLAKSGNREDIDNFKACQDTLWANVVINNDGLAATKYGLSGEYVMLSFGNWEQGGDMNFVDESDRLKTVAPKEMIIYRDGKFEKIRFEDKVIGVAFYRALIEPSKAKAIKDTYAKWKQNNP